MRALDRFRDESLTKALDDALVGGASARAPLLDKLRRASGLPGPRLNNSLVRAFAAEVAARGAAADGLLAALCAFHDDIAPYGHVDEFLAVLGVAGTGARAATDPRVRSKFLEALANAARDSRSRVRVEVTTALVAIGLAEGEGESFAETLRTWIADDDPYLTHAALDALADPEVLVRVGRERAGELLDEVYERVARESRSGRRNEGFNRLMRALAVAPAAMVARFPELSTVLERQAKNADEDVRKAITDVLPALKKGRASDRVASIEAALTASKKPSRDPRWDRLPGKRGRGK